MLTSPTIAKPFDDAKETILLTDASRLHGLGYALIQKSRKGELLLIQCGSATQQRYARTSTATVTAKLNSWFTEYVYPEYIRTDGGPQFRRDFKAYCNKHYIHHELSWPYNPESNGLAEAAVKI